MENQNNSPCVILQLNPEIPCPGVRLLGSRVDGLTVGVQLVVWRERELAWSLSGGVVSLGAGVQLAVEPKRGGSWYGENADLRCLYDPRSPGGCPLEITFSAEYLATHTLEDAWGYARQVGASLGLVGELRVRRLDLAADFEGWNFDDCDRWGWVRPGRAGVARFAQFDDQEGEESCLEAVTYGGAGRRYTGASVAPGGAIMLRVYDKQAELYRKTPDRRRFEFARWTAAGWQGEASVARVEFQLRTEGLKSFGVKTSEHLTTRKIDEIWANLTQKWVRLVDVDSSTRLCRCDVDQRWLSVQRVRFGHEVVSPAVRTYARHGANAKMALGTWLSFVAGEGRADDLLLEIPLLDRGVSEEDALAALVKFLGCWAREGVRQLAATLSHELGARGAVAYVVRKTCEVLAARSGVDRRAA